MKRINNVLVTCSVLLAILVGCTDIINPPQKETPAHETGRVRLSITGTGERTILPETPVFSKYEFIFEPLDGQEGHDKVTVNTTGSVNQTVVLAHGKWTIIAKGYVRISGITGIPNGDYRAAEGRVDITVNAGQVHNLSIDLKGGVQAGEKGIFAWEIKLPDDVQSANMAILTLEGTEIETADLMDTPQGNRALDAGYYLLALSLDNQRPKAEVLHVYAGMTSRVERTLSKAPVFDNLEDLANYLNNVPANTVDTPYDVILYGLNIETDFYENDDPLRKMYNALNGKYVNLDMGECEGQFIPDTSSSNYQSNRDRIVSIVLPSGLTSIGERAFSGCTSLALTELPAGLTSIGERAFSGCTSLALTELPAGLTSIGGGAFAFCTNLALTELPAGLTSIGNYAFDDCTSLALTELPAGLTSIGEWAFYHCTSLALTELPAGLTSIGNNAFSNCTSLALTALPAGVFIGEWAFYHCTSLALTELPAGLTSIGDDAFQNCTSLALTELPAGLTSIGGGAFQNCTSLALTGLSAGLTSIGNFAFSGCTSLALTELPAGLTSIGDRAFSGYTSLTSMSLPASVNINGNPFSGCTSLMSFTVTGAGPLSVAEGGRALVRNNTELVVYPSASGNIALSSEITSIGDGAFSGCTSLALTALPSGVTSIGSSAFYGCTSLALTELPAGLISIGSSAFSSCTSLALTALPSGVTSIGGGTFVNCTSLALAELPSGVTSIGNFAFSGCTSLALVISHAVTPPALGLNVFYNTHASLQIKVPAGSVEAYKAASGWSDYADRIGEIE